MPRLTDLFAKKKPARTTSAPRAAHKTRKIEPRRVSFTGQQSKDYLKTTTASIGFSETIPDRASFLRAYFSLVTRYVPSAAGAVWTWKNLCSTKQLVRITGGSDAQRSAAHLSIQHLDRRLSPFSFVRGGGMDFLISLFFTSLFKFGRFAGNLVLLPDQSGVATFELLDPFSVRFQKGTNAPFLLVNNHLVPTNPETFYYFALNMDSENPYGSAMIEAAKKFMDIADALLEDMRLAASNAGVPRLHIKISQPDPVDGEDENDYRDRCNNYFDSLVDELTDIGPDDNFYTWDDVEITVAGGANTKTFGWHVNRSSIDEEITSAYHLFPWITGKASFAVSRNWVLSQYDLLMSQVQSVQQEAKRFAEWIRNTHLQLQGFNQCSVHHIFSIPRDPAVKTQMQAEQIKTETVLTRIERGIIAPDDGARELGYESAYNPKLTLPSNPDRSGKPSTRNTALRQLEDFAESIENALEQIPAILKATNQQNEEQ